MKRSKTMRNLLIKKINMQIKVTRLYEFLLINLEIVMY